MAEAIGFTKMTGAGNDFIMLEDGGPALGPDLVRRLCDRRYGIGADGLMLVAGPAVLPRGDGASLPAFSVDFRNSDGSGGMLCGNGARCALEYARLTGRIGLGEERSFAFAGRLYSGAVLEPGLVRFRLDPRHELRPVAGLELEGGAFGGFSLAGHFVDLGSPHLILDVGTLPRACFAAPEGGLGSLPLVELGRMLRWHPRFAPAGVNVSFFERREGALKVRTYERGVEDETLACGTGSTATALVAWRLGLVEPQVRVVTRSGETLLVDIGAEGGRVLALSLTGPARRVFSGSFRPGELA